jgi:hypothetical protein
MSWTGALRQMKFGAVKDHGLTSSFIWNIVFFDEGFNMTVVRNFEVMLGQTLNHSV